MVTWQSKLWDTWHVYLQQPWLSVAVPVSVVVGLGLGVLLQKGPQGVAAVQHLQWSDHDTCHTWRHVATCLMKVLG